MKITRAGDYALRVLGYMASKQNKNKVFMRNELSNICGVPDSFLGKIMQALAREGILRSERGKKGGFKINKSPEEVTVYDIIKAVEGDVMINECLLDKEFCDSSFNCNIQTILGSIRNNLVRDMQKYTLQDLVVKDNQYHLKY